MPQYQEAFNEFLAHNSHKPAKWYKLEDGNSNIGQLQDHICDVICAQPNRNIHPPDLSVKDVHLHCACTYVSEFTIPRYIYETWGHCTIGKRPLQEMEVLYISLEYFVLLWES